MRGGVQRRRVLHALEDAALLAPAHERAVVPGAHQVAKRLRERERGHDLRPVPVQSLERSARALVPALDQPAPATGPQLRASVRRARHRRVVRAREDARRHERHRRDRANRECASDRPRTMTRPGPRHLLDLRLRPKTPDNLRRPNRVGGSGSAATELCVTIDRAFRHAPGAREASALGRGGRGAARRAHGKANRGYFCKECPGKGICEHGRQRPQCKECGGSGICEHGRLRSHCKECGGASICEHGRVRSYCKECGARASASTGGSEAVQ